MIPKIERGKSPGAYFTRLKYKRGWEQYFLVVSDLHYDAVGCDRKLVKKHLDQAVERDAGIFLLGDTCDLMQGKKDRRAAKHALRPEYMFDDYLGAVMEDAAKFLAPYAKNIMFISQGNHELGYKKHHEVDALSILVTHIKAETGIRPIIAPYTGWMQFKCESHTGGSRKTVRLKYHHGTGTGGAVVTKGAINSNRSVAMWEADIYVRSHIHQRFSMQMPYERISANGTIVEDQNRIYLQTGCYVTDYKDGDSWSQQKGFGSPAMGGYWLRLYSEGTSDPNNLVKWIAYPTD